jgi:hypothetical protein
MANRPEYIVVHTAAYAGPDCDRDLIDRWHREKGWAGIGYHFVIVNDRHRSVGDGTVQVGRAKEREGAHTQGINARSLGICCAGNGDVDRHTTAQRKALVELVSDLIDEFPEITVDRVIGHRDVNRLVADGILQRKYLTDKTCPGRLVSMDEIRAQVRAHRSPAPPSRARGRAPSEHDLRAAIEVLDRARTLPNARAELGPFLGHPEVRELRARPSGSSAGRPEGSSSPRPGSRGRRRAGSGR